MRAHRSHPANASSSSSSQKGTQLRSGRHGWWLWGDVLGRCQKNKKIQELMIRSRPCVGGGRLSLGTKQWCPVRISRTRPTWTASTADFMLSWIWKLGSRPSCFRSEWVLGPPRDTKWLSWGEGETLSVGLGRCPHQKASCEALGLGFHLANPLVSVLASERSWRRWRRELSEALGPVAASHPTLAGSAGTIASLVWLNFDFSSRKTEFSIQYNNLEIKLYSSRVDAVSTFTRELRVTDRSLPDLADNGP